MRPIFPVIALSVSLTGCASLATSPDWVGGSLELTAPERLAAEEQRIAEQAAREAAQPKEVAARHILVMHKGSQRRPESVTRTREEALARARECLTRLRSGDDFVALVGEYSDEPGAAERGGDLGTFDKSRMVKVFADAAFALKVGEISEVVESPFGFHVIQRTK